MDTPGCDYQVRRQSSGHDGFVVALAERVFDLPQAGRVCGTQGVALAGVLLGWLADTTSTSAGLIAGGASLVVAAALIVAGKRETRDV